MSNSTDAAESDLIMLAVATQDLFLTAIDFAAAMGSLQKTDYKVR